MICRGIYFSAPFTKRAEIKPYAAYFENLGFKVTSRWFTKNDDYNVGTAHPKMLSAILAEMRHLRRAATVVFFTCWHDESKGGMDVEFGGVLRGLVAGQKEIFIVGPRLNFYHGLVPEDHVFSKDRWDELIKSSLINAKIT